VVIPKRSSRQLGLVTTGSALKLSSCVEWPLRRPSASTDTPSNVLWHYRYERVRLMRELSCCQDYTRPLRGGLCRARGHVVAFHS
jgi:hypothetical protein